MDRINWVTKDCFNAVLELSCTASTECAQPEFVHAQLRGVIDDLPQRGCAAGYSERDIASMVYALVALADEKMMAKSQPFRDYWSSQPLQLLYFKENLAGSGFFKRLEQARESCERGDILRVFYLCLLFGFKGRFAVRGGEAPLSVLVEGVRAQLAEAFPMPEVLAPDALSPDEPPREAPRKLPLVWMAAGAVALVFVLQLGSVVLLREQVAEVSTWIREVTAP